MERRPHFRAVVGHRMAWDGGGSAFSYPHGASPPQIPAAQPRRCRLVSETWEIPSVLQVSEWRPDKLTSCRKLTLKVFYRKRGPIISLEIILSVVREPGEQVAGTRISAFSLSCLM